MRDWGGGARSEFARALALAALVAPCCASPAAAQDAPLSDALSVASDDACLTRDALVEHVRTWLGRDATPASLSIVVEADAATASFALAQGGERVATRRFDRLPAGCADRRAVLGLAIALAIDSALAERPEVLGVASDDETPGPGQATTVSGAIEVEALVAIELLPDVGFLASVALSLSPVAPLRLRAGALVSARQGAPIGRGGAELTLAAGRLDVCGAAPIAPELALGGCVGGLAGALAADGNGFDAVRSAVVPWVAVDVRLELRYAPLPFLALSLGVEGVLSVLRPRLDVLDGSGALVAARTLPLVGVLVGVGASVVLR
jgi:hypothetical protein